MLAEAARCVAGGEQLAYFDQQNLRLGAHLVGRHCRSSRRQTTTVVGVADELVDADDQFGNRMQPQKGRIADEELQHFARGDRPMAFFIRRALLFNQRFVQIEQRATDVGEAFPQHHGLV